MSEIPNIAQKSPFAVEVEEGKRIIGVNAVRVIINLL